VEIEVRNCQDLELGDALRGDESNRKSMRRRSKLVGNIPSQVIPRRRSTGERAMLNIGQKVVVITEKGLSYDGVILARAAGDAQASAYKIGLESGGHQQQGQWHKSTDVFVPEATEDEEPYLPESPQ
jgi:hypothetical protein